MSGVVNINSLPINENRLFYNTCQIMILTQFSIIGELGDHFMLKYKT